MWVQDDVANIGKSFLVFCCGLTCFGEEFVFSIAPKTLFWGEIFGELLELL
jgi:hypothetical protein